MKSDDLVSSATAAIHTRHRHRCRQQSGIAVCRLRFMASVVYLRSALMIKRSRLCRLFTSAAAASAVDSIAEQNTGIWKMLAKSDELCGAISYNHTPRALGL